MYKFTVYPKQYLEMGIYYFIIYSLIMLSYDIKKNRHFKLDNISGSFASS